jgi:hypothetical protein
MMYSIKINSPRSRSVFFSVLFSGVLASIIIVKAPEAIRLFSVGASELVNSMTDNARSGLLERTDRLNKLIQIVKSVESNAANNPSQKTILLGQSSIKRAEISSLYIEMADIVEKDAINTNFENLQLEPLSKEMVAGLKKSAIVSSEIGSSLSDFNPKNGFLSFGMSEMINSMESESKQKMLAGSAKLNDLIKIANKNKANNKDYKSEHVKIAELYRELADIISNDLHNIQTRNPRIASVARSTVLSLNNKSTDLKSHKVSVYLTEFHPEDIRY